MMFEQLVYKNHLNEVFEFGKNGIYVNLNELRDYEWNVQTKGNRISSLGHAVRSRNLPVTIICDTEEQGTEAKNTLFEVVEKDVLAMKHGRVIIGDYYFRCFVTKSQKSEYLVNKRYLKLNLTLTTDFPYWVKETAFNFRKASTGGDTLLWDGNTEGRAIINVADGFIVAAHVSDAVPTMDDLANGCTVSFPDDNLTGFTDGVVDSSDIFQIDGIGIIVHMLAVIVNEPNDDFPRAGTYLAYDLYFDDTYTSKTTYVDALTIPGYTGFPGGDQQGGLDFSFDYPYDYASGMSSQNLNNTGFVGTNFRMIVYGPCSNPAVYVNDHAYQVNCTVDSGEYLTIDSIEKTIKVTAIDGTGRNVFNLRNRDSYVFEKIMPGKNTVLLGGEFDVDIILLEERSEPKWT